LLLLWLLEPARHWLQRVLQPWGPERWYQAGLSALDAIATEQTRILQSGYLRRYLSIIVVSTVTVGAWALIRGGGLHWPMPWPRPSFYEFGLACLIVAAAGAAVASPSRLGAVAAMGAAGYGVALIYLLFGAPDLAMTQFLIESLTVILFVLAFYHLPRFSRLTSRTERGRDIVISLAAGGLMTTLVLSVLGVEYYPSVSSYYVEVSVPLAHARNIVNAILVDFRGIDTLGEISVLAIAALGVYALLKMGRVHALPAGGGEDVDESESGGNS
jgi:multicomponent Na+:H+ antiporter subunit A